MRVLHVTECFAAGTGRAVVNFARSSGPAGVEHGLVALDRGSGLAEEPGVREAFMHLDVGSGPARTLLPALGASLAAWRPDVVHLHSTIAGLAVRGLPRALPPLVYTPHCYAFLRQDLPRAARLAVLAAEKALAPRLSAVVGVSPHELSWARRLSASTPRCLVSNWADLGDGEAPASPAPPALRTDPDGPLRVVGVGRLSPQKDPQQFADVVRALHERGRDVEAVWLGDGDEALAAALTGAGVTVSGWVPRSEVVARIRAADVLLHTAAWEAAPLVVFEALALGTPVLARELPQYAGLLSSDMLYRSVAEATSALAERTRPQWSAAGARQRDDVAREQAPFAPADVLPGLYRSVAAVRSVQPV